MDLDREVIDVLRERRGWIEPAVLVREYAVRLEAIPSVKLLVRIYRDAARDRDPYRFELSHYAATPTQAGPYIPSGPWRPSEVSALRAGLEAVADWVSGAIREGHSPDESWLKPSSTWS